MATSQPKAHHITREVDTKNGREGKAYPTKLTWDFTDMDRAEIEELAARTLTINWQRETRGKLENGEKVPTELTVNAKKYNSETHRGAGTKLTPERVLANADKIVAADPKKAEALIKQLQDSLKAAKNGKNGTPKK